METKREFRNAALTSSGDANLRKVEGYALVFNRTTVLWSNGGIDYKEVIDPHALDDADMSDVVFRYNHSDIQQVLARTSNNTLKLDIDDIGLHITAELADTTLGNDIYKLIQRKDVSKMSFAFSVKEDAYNTETHTRTILKFDKIFDVSAVDVPAYDDTCISELRKRQKVKSVSTIDTALTFLGG